MVSSHTTYTSVVQPLHEDTVKDKTVQVFSSFEMVDP
jgi:hypothetical protein